MTVRELFSTFVSIDVMDDYDERCYIGFDGGTVALTNAGAEKFERALNLNATLYTDMAVIHCESGKDAQSAKELFDSLAGFCAEEDYNTWFTIL